jgi:hypothetical protein
MVQVVAAYPPYLLGHRALEPVYEGAAELGLTFTLQAGGDYSGTNPGVTPFGSPGGSVLEAHVAWESGGQPHLASLLLAGMLDRHRELRVAFSAFGAGWVPAFLWRLDTEVRRGVDGAGRLERRPSEQVGAQVRFVLTGAELADSRLRLALDGARREGLILYGSGPRRDLASESPGAALADEWLQALSPAGASAAYPRLA